MKKNKSLFIATVGIFTAIAIALSFIESLIPPLPLVPPGVKLGLSNIVIMFAASSVGGVAAIATAIIKSVFVMLTRGFTAGLLSACGGLLSVTVMILMFRFSEKSSVVFIAVLSAISHNIGQLIGVYFITDTESLVFYLPVLALSGVVFGVITGIILKTVLPHLERLRSKIE